MPYLRCISNWSSRLTVETYNLDNLEKAKKSREKLKNKSDSHKEKNVSNYIINFQAVLLAPSWNAAANYFIKLN